MRSLTNVMAMPSVLRGRATYKPHLVTVILIMNNLNFVLYCFLKSLLQNLLLRSSPARRHESHHVALVLLGALCEPVQPTN